MAYPTYVNYISAKDSSATTSHTITWPSGVTTGNLLYGLFACKTTSEQNINDSSNSANITVNSAVTVEISGGGEIQVLIFYGLAAATNTLVITSNSDSVVGRWIVYEFADHNIAGSPAGHYGLAGEFYSNTSGTNFDMPACPDPSYGITTDYTWLAFAIYDQTATYTCPTDFSNQVNNIRESTSEASISVARRNYNTIQYDPGSWDTGVADNMEYITHTVRIPPGMYPESTPHGFGFFVPSSNVDLP